MSKGPGTLEPPRNATIATGFVMLGLTVALIVFSEQGYRATVGALKLFFEVVFPSLLPFFILSDIMLASGMVHFLGVFFEPLMRPLFRVPGVGSFVFSMGLAAGYPMDAVLTAKFRRQGLCTKVEGERLLAFTNSADPLFLWGAVAVGMFGMPGLGTLLAVAHYLSGLLVGLTFRFYGRGKPETPEPPRPWQGMWRRAIDAMLTARAEDGRPFGRVVNEAISESVSTLFMIMSFIVLFAVTLRVLTETHILTVVSTPLDWIFRLIGLSPNLVSAAVQGIFEIDLGASAAAQAQAPLIQQLAVVSAIVAWSGLSVHGQVASVLADTDISMKPYMLARLLHAVYAGILTVLLWPLAAKVSLGTILPVFAARDYLISGPTGPTLVDGLHFSLEVVVLSLMGLAGAATVISLVRTGRRWLGG